jgi:hypothetical protein
MTLNQLIAFFGKDKAELAYKIGYTVPAISYWEKKGVIPYKAQRIIEGVTGGKLVARKPGRITS